MIPWLVMLLQLPASQPATSAATSRDEVFVAADGSEKYQRISDAIDDCAAKTRSDEPLVIHVKAGVYRELLEVPSKSRPILLVGVDPQTTVITGSLNANLPGPDGQKIGTGRTATARIRADDFTGENLTFENTALPDSGQAIALAVSGDRVTFHHCRFIGFQDTIYAERGRHYFKGCTIVGAVDFIFGGATEYFEDCTLHCVADGFITAASTPAERPFGLVFDHCHITAEPGVHTFLGRPWRPFAATAYLHCEIDDVLRRDGWNDWENVEQEKTARYAVYQNTGAGASAGGRLNWVRQLNEDDAANYQPTSVLSGWNPATLSAERP